MPQPKAVPAYKLHKATGQARVIIDGRHRYLGPFGSPESFERYARLVAERKSVLAPSPGELPSACRNQPLRSARQRQRAAAALGAPPDELPRVGIGPTGVAPPSERLFDRCRAIC